MSRVKIALIIVILFCLFLLKGMIWIMIGSLFFASLIFVLSKPKVRQRFEGHIFLKSVFIFLFIFILAIVLRVFIFEIFAIPTASMEGHLLQGDKIIVSKLNYGPQLPRSRYEIPWVNFFFFLFSDKPVNTNENEWSYARLTGFSRIKRNDIVVFDIPTENREYIIKRCLGLPGDVFQIKNAEITINGQPYYPPETVKNFYKVTFTNWPDFYSALNEMKITTGERKVNFKKNGEVDLVLSKGEKNKLSSLECIKSIALTGQPNPLEFLLFTGNHFDWTYDSFGPVKIPRKGLKIHLNENNIALYAYILETYEKVNIKSFNGKFTLNGHPTTSYTFKKDYYLMIGDNRSASLDSRFFGFVCEENILGKALFVIFSNDNDGLRWKRFFHFL